VTAGRFRILVSGVLIVGVSVSAILIALGFAGSLLVGWEGSLVGGATGTSDVTDFGSLAAALSALRPVGLAQLGLLVLVATPVVRVGASVAAFALEGDRLYAAITLVVLAILLTSLFVVR
jgi:uncharacterized membrane protein